MPSARTPRLGGIPAIAITAFGSFSIEDQTRQAGFNGYLAKPIDPVGLCRRFTRCYRHPAHRNDASPHHAQRLPPKKMFGG